MTVFVSIPDPYFFGETPSFRKISIQAMILRGISRANLNHGSANYFAPYSVILLTVIQPGHLKNHQFDNCHLLLESYGSHDFHRADLDHSKN